MKPTAWNYCFISIIGLFLLFQTGTNYFYDHYGVFGSGLSSKAAINFNQRHGKVEYLAEHKGQFNAFLLGSSRLGHFDIKQLSQVASQDAGSELRFYNLSVFSGVPKDYLLFLQHLKKAGHPIDAVVIGLDMYPFFLPPDLSKPDFRHHPSATGENPLSFYLSYLFRTSFMYLATEAGYFFGNERAVYEHDLTDGSYRPLRAIRDIEEDFDGYWQKEIRKAKQGMESFQSTVHVVDQGQLNELRELVAWLKENVQNYRFFVNPRHPQNDAYYSGNEHSVFARGINEVLSGAQSKVDRVACLMQDNRNFYDLMHYKPTVANRIVESIYNVPASQMDICGNSAIAVN